MKTDDPKFTAHALGELEGLTPAERAEIEELLKTDSEAAAEDADTKALAARLRAGLQAEKSEALHAEQRATVLAAMQKVVQMEPARKLPMWRRTMVRLAAAACIAAGLCVSAVYVVMDKNRAARESSVLTDQDLSSEVILREKLEMEMVHFAKQRPGQAGAPLLKADQKQMVRHKSLSYRGLTSGVTLGDEMVMRLTESISDDPAALRGRRLALEREPLNTAAFDSITENPFLPVRENPLSTLSTDVDTASYALVRSFLNARQRPPKGAVRIEELLNYFTYDYPQPAAGAPFSASMEVAGCPWTPAHRLVRIGLKGREVAKEKRPASNLVFLVDVSGSMEAANRLPLLRHSLGLLIDQLGKEDRVAIVVYAGSSGCVLQSTTDKAEMRLALERLEAGGSTNGAEGIELAYEIARKNFIKGGTNRVILGTDGDWNVGITNQSDLFELITRQAKSGVFLTVLGFGMGNLKDSMLVKLADKGNGNYGYIDTLLEAKKLLVEQISGTLVTIAKDVKIQVEFNPSQVSGYRLIGYEKRLLAKEDFNDDTKDAGEIGAGHAVTALYEVVPAGTDLPKTTTVDPLKYQAPAPAEKPAVGNENEKRAASSELLTLKLRYKAPDGDTSKLLEFPLTDAGASWKKSSRDFRFAAAVAGYGMLLRDSEYKGNATWKSVRQLALDGKGADANGYRTEFISLIEKAEAVTR